MTAPSVLRRAAGGHRHAVALVRRLRAQRVIERGHQPGAVRHDEVAARRVRVGGRSPLAGVGDVPPGLVRRPAIEALDRHRLTEIVVVDAARHPQGLIAVNRLEGGREVVAGIAPGRDHQPIAVETGAGLDRPAGRPLFRAGPAIGLERHPLSARRRHADRGPVAVDGDGVGRVQAVHQLLGGGLPPAGRHRAGRLFGRLTRIVATGAVQLVGSREAARDARVRISRRVSGPAPVPGEVVRARQGVQITAHGKPVVVRLDRQLSPLGGHEAVDALTAPQHVLDVARDNPLAVESRVQALGRLGEVGDGPIDGVFLLRAVEPAAIEGLVEAPAELVGFLLDPRQQLLDLIVVDPRRPVRLLIAQAGGTLLGSRAQADRREQTHGRHRGHAFDCRHRFLCLVRLTLAQSA